MKRTLLSIDWDYFFPRLLEATEEYVQENPDRGKPWDYDWGHNEAPLYVDTMLWNIRAAHFLSSLGTLPGTTGEEVTFWDRFQGRFAADCPVIVAESHASIIHQLARAEFLGKPYTRVWNFDAHHDMGYGDGNLSALRVNTKWSCDNWGDYAVIAGAEVLLEYPHWREPEPKPRLPLQVTSGKTPSRVDAVFICRSGAWSPPWLDEKFVEFVRSCPAITTPGGYELAREPEWCAPMRVRKLQIPAL